jgi:hypothetical protein
MNVAAASKGVLTLDVPTVLLDKKPTLFSRDQQLLVSVDGKQVAVREKRAAAARKIVIPVPAGAREIRISGDPISLR